MLATLVEEPFDDPQWLYEVKWDGYRAVAFINDGRARLVSRNQNELTGEFPEIAQAMQDLPWKMPSSMAKWWRWMKKAVRHSA